MMDVGRWIEGKMFTQLRRYLETVKGGRQLHRVNRSVYYRVTYIVESGLTGSSSPAHHTVKGLPGQFYS